ncbi:hypothetical protein D3C83_100510 [compost metagenome]
MQRLRTRETKREIPAVKGVVKPPEAKPEEPKPEEAKLEPKPDAEAEMPKRLGITTLLETPRAKNPEKKD